MYESHGILQFGYHWMYNVLIHFEITFTASNIMWNITNFAWSFQFGNYIICLLAYSFVITVNICL